MVREKYKYLCIIDLNQIMSVERRQKDPSAKQRGKKKGKKIYLAEWP